MLKTVILVALLSSFNDFNFARADNLPTEIVIVDYNDCKNVDYAPITCIKFGEKYYFIEMQTKLTWLAAAHNCRRNNGNLVTIESAEEMAAITNYLDPSMRSKLENFGVWTAGNNLVNMFEFMSIGNGRELPYTHWGKDQPDNKRNRENCVLLQVEDNAFAMFDANCQDKHHYMCELNTTIPARREFD